MTDNHDYNTPKKGTENWHVPLNENFDRLDTGVEIRDVDDSLGQYTPKPCAKYFATDTGNIYIGDGDQWQQLSSAGQDPSFGSVSAKQSSVASRDNEINVRAIKGETLSERISKALATIDTSGQIRIPRPVGGETWDWGEQLDIDVGHYRGITLSIDRGTEIAYGGTGWVLTLDGGDASQRNTFAIVGNDAEFFAKESPEGFLRADDVSHIMIKTNTRDFVNSDRNATAVLLRNVEAWTEGWKLEGNHRNCDRGIDFAPASVTGGSGGSSFLDGRAENLAVNARDFGVRLRGNHKACVFDNPRFFFAADDCEALILDGNLSGTTFVCPRFDDTNNDYSNEVAIATKGDFKSFEGKPMFISPDFNLVDTIATKSEKTHDLWALITEGGKAGLRELESDAALFARRTGGLVVQNDSNTEVFEVDRSGDVRTGGDWRTGDAPLFHDSIRFPTFSTDPTPPDGTAVMYVSDGSVDVTGEAGDLVVALTRDDGETVTEVMVGFGSRQPGVPE